MLRQTMNMLLTRSMLFKGERTERGHAIECCLWAFHDVLIKTRNMRGDDWSSDPLPIDIDTKPNPVRGSTVREEVGPSQSNVELCASNRFNERCRGHITVLSRIFGERRAIHADGDGSARETIGVHLGRCKMVTAVVSFLLCVVVVGEVKVLSKAKVQT